MSHNLEKGACSNRRRDFLEEGKPAAATVNNGGENRVREKVRGPHLARHLGGMVLWATILFLQGAGFVGSMTGIPGVPENITIMFLNPTSVRVSWSTSQVEQVEKYDVTYKPTDARVVVVVAGNSEAVTLSGLRADTQYQLVVTAVRAGKKFRSRPIVFRTLGITAAILSKLTNNVSEPPRTSPQQDAVITGGPLPPPPPSSQQPQAYIQVRGVEVGIVVLVLIVWAGAIALFFNRWGKIRMLLPYQPDYKEQLKVPGTGVCASANAAYTQHPTQHTCSQHLHWSSHHVDSLDSGGGLGWPRTSRPRVNSAIDVAGFLSQEFLRRHGSTSKLCRKVRSADNLPLASINRQHDHRKISKEDGIDGDRESFLKPSQEERFEDLESKRQNSLEGYSKDNQEIALLEPNHQACSRDSPVAPTSSGTRRSGGWRTGGSYEYVRCPVRQPASMDERCYRRSCDSDTTRLPRYHYYHRRADVERHTKSCDYARRTPESSIEIQHFGLPILSVSEPSPPDENERVDEYL